MDLLHGLIWGPFAIKPKYKRKHKKIKIAQNLILLPDTTLGKHMSKFLISLGLVASTQKSLVDHENLTWLPPFLIPCLAWISLYNLDN